MLFVQVLRAHFADKSSPTQLPSILQHLDGYLRHRMHERITLKTMAEQVGFSVPHTIRLCRQHWHQTPHERLLQLRLQHSLLLLQNVDLRVAQVAGYCGFADTRHFVHVFRQRFGMTPTQARHADLKGAQEARTGVDGDEQQVSRAFAAVARRSRATGGAPDGNNGS